MRFCIGDALPAVAMGFVESPEKALAVLVAYIAIQQMENYLLIPFLMREGVDLPPALTIVVDVIAWGVFHGATGYAAYRLDDSRLSRDGWLLRQYFYNLFRCL